MATQSSHTIKTYMSFAYPVDPANVKTLVDLDISYALSTTLVDWNDSRNLSAGLAKQVESPNINELHLQLRPEAKWSDGSPVTAKQVIRSFDHAKSLHDEAMKGLFEMLTSLEAKGDRTLVFKLNRPVAQSQILHKLTEPVYGVVFAGENARMDLTKTTGPFTLKSSSQQELVLAINSHWYGFDLAMAKEVIIRQPVNRAKGEEEGFADDPWPNLTTASSLMSVASENSFKKQSYSIWNRNLDRLFFLSPSERLRTAQGRHLIGVLGSKLDRNQLLKGLGGYRLSEQFFPPGYVIFDPEFKKSGESTEVPEEFKKKPLQLLAAEGRVGKVLQENIIAAVKSVTGVAPQFTIVPLNKVAAALTAGQYDVAVLTVAVNDPNVEGPVSFLFGMSPPLIANSDAQKGNFKEQVVKARGQDEKIRNSEYRRIFSQATNEGCVLPLFHFSSIAIAREGIDLSKIPTTDETVAFAKIRFK